MAAHEVVGKSFTFLRNPKHMVSSLVEIGARQVVTRFFAAYISIGSLTIMEDDGTIFTFEGTNNFSPKITLKVHHPRFYWKIMMQADLGLANAYINGDFSFVDKDDGLLNFILVLIANRDKNSSVATLKKKRGWWSPPLFTASIAYAKYFFRHLSRQNSLTQVRRNISQHYDLMEDEDLKVAQMRKNFVLIEKARTNKNHQVLDIGCGWGSLAIEIVKQSGCHYTGITLSEEQLKYAENKVQDLGLQDHIKFLLCDYRQLPSNIKYDRIISCGMIEAVGHEFLEDFFGTCESVLAENGLLVLQFVSIPDERYDEYRLSSDFIKEYIFPGVCIPSLSRITTAMARASKLCVEHLENIGIHYYQTLRCWRKNFLNNKSKILELGFDERFVRTWEYYFDYSAAGLKSRTLGDYQIVFSRPGNVATFNNPYRRIPSAY
ncbi:tuberculostearic acid methyltransferase UfaA1-like isoform X2 [Benincasa hispida]|uniref:tuberculostearic acid methyltransferase UfaA1-like isoform X2 n=1 Tax=Benincasa hispida TaxID=102211 RepID=UPI0019027D08|nr:tuberculostearic acid methyltransferase UfaA1-like isoform X2 [Benincasa hispida]